MANRTTRFLSFGVFPVVSILDFLSWREESSQAFHRYADYSLVLVISPFLCLWWFGLGKDLLWISFAVFWYALWFCVIFFGMVFRGPLDK